MTQTKLSPTDTRYAFIKEVTTPLEERAEAILLARSACGVEIGDLGIEDLTEIARKMADHGSDLGRTPRWKTACMFAYAEITANPGNQQHARWAVLQGSIQMGWAA